MNNPRILSRGWFSMSLFGDLGLTSPQQPYLLEITPLYVVRWCEPFQPLVITDPADDPADHRPQVDCKYYGAIMAMWNSASLARDGTDVAFKARVCGIFFVGFFDGGENEEKNRTFKWNMWDYDGKIRGNHYFK